MRRLGPNLLAVAVLAFWSGIYSPGALSADESVSRDAAAGDATASTAEAPRGASSSADATRGRIGFIGRNLFGRADGRFHAWRVVEHAVDLANPAASHAVVEVTLASVDTGSEGRDDHLRTADFFDVERFPIATVRGHSARALEPSPSGRPRYAVQLDVDLHGVRKTLEGEVEVALQEPVVVEGGFVMRRTDFGVGEKPSRWNPMAIDDEVPVRFRIAFE